VEENVMDDISRISRVGFGLGNAQTAILPKQGRGGKAKSLKTETPPGEDSPESLEKESPEKESLDKDHLDLEA
jgi:hypothetical protein